MTEAAQERCDILIEAGWVVPVEPHGVVLEDHSVAVRGDTSGGGGKPATLETGAVVRVPLFVGQDEVIKVDTRSGEYVSRVK